MNHLNQSLIQTRLGSLEVRQTAPRPESVMLWPSIFTDHKIYEKLALKLSDRYRVVLIDGPGHGASLSAKGPFTMSDCGGAMADILDSLKINEVIAGGTSWGGIAAAELTLMAPKRVKALIMMNTPMDIDSMNPGLTARLITFGARWALKSRVFRNGVAKSFFDPKTFQENPSFAMHFHEMLDHADAKSLSLSVRSVLIESTPLFEKLKGIKTNSLIIAGKEDSMYSLGRQAAAALQMHNARFECVSGRHISVIDALPEVVTHIDRFLTQLGVTK